MTLSCDYWLGRPNQLSTSSLWAALPLLYALYRVQKALAGPSRYKKVSRIRERVIVLGASSGIGRSTARQYAERGARVIVVGRRSALIEEVAKECSNARAVGLQNPSASSHKEKHVIGFTGDFTSP